mmetsp:Transcript_48249/g.138581  ORF Transcript_48249/g.138581 Transcript_48249/m.138581 type:complete len:303 (+) Transcript_48249:236-1144(+)
MNDVQKPLMVHLLRTLTLQSIGLPHRIAPIRQTLDQVPALLGPTLVASRLVNVLEGEARVLLPRSRRRCQKALLLLRPGSRAHREIQKCAMPDVVLAEHAVVVVHQARAAGRQLLLGHGHAGDRLDQLFEGGLRTTREAGAAHQRGGSLEDGGHEEPRLLGLPLLFLAHAATAELLFRAHEPLLIPLLEQPPERRQPAALLGGGAARARRRRLAGVGPPLLRVLAPDVREAVALAARWRADVDVGVHPEREAAAFATDADEDPDLPVRGARVAPAGARVWERISPRHHPWPNDNRTTPVRSQ